MRRFDPGPRLQNYTFYGFQKFSSIITCFLKQVFLRLLSPQSIPQRIREILEWLANPLTALLMNCPIQTHALTPNRERRGASSASRRSP